MCCTERAFRITPLEAKMLVELGTCRQQGNTARTRHQRATLDKWGSMLYPTCRPTARCSLSTFAMPPLPQMWEGLAKGHCAVSNQPPHWDAEDAFAAPACAARVPTAVPVPAHVLLGDGGSHVAAQTLSCRKLASHPENWQAMRSAMLWAMQGVNQNTNRRATISARQRAMLSMLPLHSNANQTGQQCEWCLAAQTRLSPRQ